MHTAGHRLRAKLEFTAPVVVAAAERLWTNPRVREIYPVYLTTMHMIARAAVPLMQAACERARERAEHDPLAEPIVDFLINHIEELLGRDALLLEDLAATGADPELPLQAIPSPKVASLVGAHYYWVHHHHPIAVLGYVAAIETYPPPLGFTERLRERTGFPKAAYRTIARRELTDPQRGCDLYELMDTLPLNRRHETLIGLSALHTVHAGVDVLEEIHDRVTQRPGS
ncbi:MAG TPA: hypothetical protein VK034_27090 [Enhygromyxa sp.]|nr:hypothetical protein [Enhygromyxa sp.]